MKLEPTRGPWHIEMGLGNSWNGARIVGVDGTTIARLTRNADKSLWQKQADGEIIIAAVNKALGHEQAHETEEAAEG